MDALLGFEEQTPAPDADDQVKSSSSRSYKLVPWLNWDEWAWVRDSLFSDSPDEIESAIKRISTWRSRGCLPVVIDVTASIVEIQQKDPFYWKDLASDAIHSEQMLAMLYCMAILRLVNCVVEKTRKKTEISIAEAAAAIGIPRTLIDIRHEGSHRDLPALTLVRDSAVKAIHWLKSYYWEPQSEEIPIRRDGTAKIRKEIKSKLQELATCLKVRQSSLPGSSLIKGKRGKHREQLYGRNKFFSLMASKLNLSKSGGSKKHATKTLKSLLHLYSNSSSEVLSVLLDILLKALDSSDLVWLPKDYQIGQDIHKQLDGWKLVITRLSNKEPELLVMLLKAILNMIGTQEAMKYATGTYLASMESKTGTDKIEQLSFLFAWLVGQLKLLKPFFHKHAKTKTEVSASETDMSNPILMDVLRKSLIISSRGNKQLMDSALHLAELMGNIRLMEKLSKLCFPSFPDLDVTEEIYSPKSTSDLLVQQDESIHQAENKLELLKFHLAQRRIVKMTDGDLGRGSRWSVVKSWNPCPIGMLPRDLGSSGCLPVLDHNNVTKMPGDSSERTQISEMNHSGAEEPSSDVQCDQPSAETRNKREACDDICLLDKSSVKKMRELLGAEVECESDENILLPSDIRGCLMINGVWKKIEKEELLAIKSGVRILV